MTNEYTPVPDRQPVSDADALQFSYDPDTDLLTIEGVKYAGQIFRDWSNAAPAFGHAFQFRRRVDGPVELRKVPVENVCFRRGKN